jgi:hypothetical protein
MRLFNGGPDFAGPNCHNAAFVAGGLFPDGCLRHVSTDESQQLLGMYYARVSTKAPVPGDVVVYNDWDHAALVLGGGLVFHKKSYLKDHRCRIVGLRSVYAADPHEWTPGPFDGESPFSTDETVRTMAVFRRRPEAVYDLGALSAADRGRVAVISHLMEGVMARAPRWCAGRELGYFVERLLEGLVADFSPMQRSSNPALAALYTQVPSLRDQMNQSIERELLSSAYAQAHADEVLRRIWVPRNEWTRALVRLVREQAGLTTDAASVEAALDRVAGAFDQSPLPLLRGAP